MNTIQFTYIFFFSLNFPSAIFFSVSHVLFLFLSFTIVSSLWKTFQIMMMAEYAGDCLLVDDCNLQFIDVHIVIKYVLYICSLGAWHERIHCKKYMHRRWRLIWWCLIMVMQNSNHENLLVRANNIHECWNVEYSITTRIWTNQMIF